MLFTILDTVHHYLYDHDNNDDDDDEALRRHFLSKAFNDLKDILFILESVIL
jgi:hypothetical protein